MALVARVPYGPCGPCEPGNPTPSANVATDKTGQQQCGGNKAHRRIKCPARACLGSEGAAAGKLASQNRAHCRATKARFVRRGNGSGSTEGNIEHGGAEGHHIFNRGDRAADSRLRELWECASLFDLRMITTLGRQVLPFRIELGLSHQPRH